MVYRDALSDSLVFTADVSGTGLLVDSGHSQFQINSTDIHGINNETVGNIERVDILYT